VHQRQHEDLEMPTYEYECQSHGSFDLYRPMRESEKPGHCPVCGGASARAVTAPNLRVMAPAIRSAMERNEKSRHAPHVCGTGCEHHHPAKKSPGAKKDQGAKPKLEAYRGPRPWVVEHR
jgi:putative FmdB family regulatory protein